MLRSDFEVWVADALNHHGGSATLKQVAIHIWNEHSTELKDPLYFYSWQYDYRWAATSLRKKGIMKSIQDSRRGIWELS